MVPDGDDHGVRLQTPAPVGGPIVVDVPVTRHRVLIGDVPVEVGPALPQTGAEDVAVGVGNAGREGGLGVVPLAESVAGARVQAGAESVRDTAGIDEAGAPVED